MVKNGGLIPAGILVKRVIPLRNLKGNQWKDFNRLGKFPVFACCIGGEMKDFISLELSFDGLGLSMEEWDFAVRAGFAEFIFE